MKLEQTIHDRSGAVDELLFREPSALTFERLDQANEWNAQRAKRPEDIQSTSMVLLEDLTGITKKALRTMTFEDLGKASEIVGELMEDESGKDSSSDSGEVLPDGETPSE